jgi:hypothetical protein
MPPVNQPMVAFDERRAINRLAVAVAGIRGLLNQDTKHLGSLLESALHAGDLGIAAKAAEAADQGDHVADAALRTVGAELLPRLLQGRELEPGHLQAVAYLQRVAKRDPLKRKPGRYTEHGAFFRYIGICLLVLLACAAYDVRPTRNRADRRAGRRASASLRLRSPATASA